MPISMFMPFMPIIPYFIGFLLPQNFSLESFPVYTFNVDINTYFVNVSTNCESTADVSFDLTCQLISNNILKCYIPERSIDYTSTNDNITDNEFTLSPLNYSNINFTMEFDDIRVKMLDIEKKDVENINSVKMIYEMIGDQLSIGTNIEWKEEKFHEMEQTIIGICSTFYEFLEANHSSQLNYTLKILLLDRYSEFHQKESVDIRKYRSVQECCSNCSYILGMILWTDLFLTTDFAVSMTHSASQMILDKHYFSSATNNSFVLYDEKNKLMGRVEENINVILSAVNM